MYNVLEKLRAGEPLSKAEVVTHEQGLVSVLRQLHDDLDEVARLLDELNLPPHLHSLWSRFLGHRHAAR
jgi:hypothetical protein